MRDPRPTLKVTRKYDGNGREMRNARPIIQRINYFRLDGKAVTNTGDIWDVKRDSKGYVTVGRNEERRRERRRAA